VKRNIPFKRIEYRSFVLGVRRGIMVYCRAGVKRKTAKYF